MGEIDGRKMERRCGSARPGPDRGKGGKYLVVSPDYSGEIPSGYFTDRSGTYSVFVFWRGFSKNPHELAEPARNGTDANLRLRKKETAKPLQFPTPRRVPANISILDMARRFDMLCRFIKAEYIDPAQMYIRGTAAELGIVKGEPFAPDANTRALLDQAARAAHHPRHCLHAGAPEKCELGIPASTGSTFPR